MPSSVALDFQVPSLNEHRLGPKAFQLKTTLDSLFAKELAKKRNMVDRLDPVKLGYQEPEVILGWGADATVVDIGDQLACRIPKKETWEGENEKKTIGEFQARALCKIRDSGDAQLQQASSKIEAYDPDTGIILMSKINDKRCLEMFKNLDTSHIEGITIKQLVQFFTTVDKLTKLGIQPELKNVNIFYNADSGFKLIDMISRPEQEALSRRFIVDELDKWVTETVAQCYQANKGCSEIVNNLKTKIKEALIAMSITEADLYALPLSNLFDYR